MTSAPARKKSKASTATAAPRPISLAPIRANDQALPEEVALIVHRYLSQSCPETAKVFERECAGLKQLLGNESKPAVIPLTAIVDQFIQYKQREANQHALETVAKTFTNNGDDTSSDSGSGLSGSLLHDTLLGVHSLIADYQRQLRVHQVDSAPPTRAELLGINFSSSSSSSSSLTESVVATTTTKATSEEKIGAAREAETDIAPVPQPPSLTVREAKTEQRLTTPSKKRKTRTPQRRTFQPVNNTGNSIGNASNSSNNHTSNDSLSLAAPPLRTLSSLMSPLQSDSNFGPSSSPVSPTFLNFLHKIEINGEQLALDESFAQHLADNINQHRSLRFFPSPADSDVADANNGQFDAASVLESSPSFDQSFLDRMLEEAMDFPIVQQSVAIDGPHGHSRLDDVVGLDDLSSTPATAPVTPNSQRQHGAAVRRHGSADTPRGLTSKRHRALTFAECAITSPVMRQDSDSISVETTESPIAPSAEPPSMPIPMNDRRDDSVASGASVDESHSAHATSHSMQSIRMTADADASSARTNGGGIGGEQQPSSLPVSKDPVDALLASLDDDRVDEFLAMIHS